MCRRWLLLRWRRKKICNNTTTKKRTQKREKLARASQNSPYSNPLCPFFPSSFHSFICHAGGEIQKRSICIYKTKRKQTMKKRAPTLPPTIIDRPLSMIAMRVTFSRACARARKKKVILYARANARKCARESEEEMKKKCVFRYRYKIHENSLSNFYTSSLKRNTSKTSNFARIIRDIHLLRCWRKREQEERWRSLKKKKKRRWHQRQRRSLRILLLFLLPRRQKRPAGRKNNQNRDWL